MKLIPCEYLKPIIHYTILLGTSIPIVTYYKCLNKDKCGSLGCIGEVKE